MHVNNESLEIIKLFSTNDKFKNLHTNLLKCYNDSSKNRVEKFIASLEKLVPGIPNEDKNLKANGFILLGHQKFINEDFPGAAAAYGKSMKIDQKIFSAHYFAGLCCIESGYFYDAVPYLQAALRLNPSAIGAQFQLGKAYYLHHDPQTAVTYFNALVEKAKDLTSDIYYYRGLCYRGLKKDTAALKDFKQAQQLDPKNPDVAFAIKLLEGKVNSSGR